MGRVPRRELGVSSLFVRASANVFRLVGEENIVHLELNLYMNTTRAPS